MSQQSESDLAYDAASHIYVVRGFRVLVDTDLALLYGVLPKRLNEAVRRNGDRFPADLGFRLSAAEWQSLRSQIATLKTGRGAHRRHPPTVFAEHGALMAAMLLNSGRAVEMSVYVIRAFVRLRSIAAASPGLARCFDIANCDIKARSMALHSKSRSPTLNSSTTIAAGSSSTTSMRRPMRGGGQAWAQRHHGRHDPEY